MLIAEDDILPRFMEHLSWATEIDLATAWATSHQGLSALQRQRPSPEVRAVVGLWGNLTDPFALRTLAKIGQLRGPDAGRHFHPKVFIFRGGGKSRCLGRKREFHVRRFRNERRGRVRDNRHRVRTGLVR